MLPSRDSVGRTYPLILARLTPASDPDAAGFLSSAESAGCHAIQSMLAPQAVQTMLSLRPEAPPLPDLAAEGETLWWTEVADRRIAMPELPSYTIFAAMLEAASEAP
jgi:hypothetical protein